MATRWRVMVARIRPFFLLLSLLALLCIAFPLTHVGRSLVHRSNVGATLIATFFLFPFSANTKLVSDDDVQRFLSVSTADESLSRAPGNLTYIPKRIHQVKLGGLAMRPAWTLARQSCLDLHPSWQFTLWQDKEANEFVQREYPDVFDAYMHYPFEIQRSNILRYLLLDHFGGVYLDLDLRCRVALDEVLRDESFITPPANPSGVNNAFIASAPHHPFWRHLIDNINAYNLAWFHSPYISNMMSTGCHFFSTMHRTFKASEKHSLSVLSQEYKLNGHVTTPLFEHLGASSWHKGDAKMILRLGQAVEAMKRHSRIVTLVSALLLLALTFAVWRVAMRRRRSHPEGYVDLERSKEMVESYS